MRYRSNKGSFSGLSIIPILLLCGIIFIGFKYVLPFVILIACILALFGFFKEKE